MEGDRAIGGRLASHPSGDGLEVDEGEPDGRPAGLPGHGREACVVEVELADRIAAPDDAAVGERDSGAPVAPELHAEQGAGPSGMDPPAAAVEPFPGDEDRVEEARRGGPAGRAPVTRPGSTALSARSAGRVHARTAAPAGGPEGLPVDARGGSVTCRTHQAPTRNSIAARTNTTR